MASVQQSDGSEDVSDFLRRVKELEHRRENEDTQRSRKLEEDIIQGRREREARRLERARSLSPEKGSPVPSSRSLNSPRSTAKPELPASPLNNTAIAPAISNSFETRLDAAVHEPQKTADTQALASSDDVDVASFSSSASSRLKPSSNPEPEALAWQRIPRAEDTVASSVGPSQTTPDAVGQEQMPSRSQISQSLAAKDPSWFRQTQDGSRGSAAFRRNAQDNETQSQSESQRKELAGLSQRIPPFIDIPGEASNLKSSSFNSQNATQGRSPSPTKGMGGFVQSAMLKRSESVSKRWSAQATPASTSRNAAASSESQLPAESVPSESSSTSPGALHSEEVKTSSTIQSKEYAPPVSSQVEDASQVTSPPISIRPQTPNNSRDVGAKPASEAVPPSSPSKRWSPLKSTWLESALNKPEATPPTKFTYSPSQPAWMAQLAKAKQERASRDLSAPTRESTHPSSEPAVSSKHEAGQTADLVQSISPPQSKPKPQSLSGSRFNQVESDQTLQRSTNSFSVVAEKPITPPKKDFRSSLKAAVTQPDQPAGQELEFRNAFGKLKRTQTEKYVAPDELKDNFLRGKAGLAVTGGPQKSARKDELKESLIKQREAMQAKSKDSGTSGPSPASSVAVPIPEAIAKKKALSKPATISSNQPESYAMPAARVEQLPKKPEAPGPLRPKPPHTLNEGANNFNSNLANILAKGPPRQNSNDATSPSDIQPSTLSRTLSSQNESQSGQLQHMTKARARGPKRRLPNTGSSTAEKQTSTKISEPTSTRTIASGGNQPSVTTSSPRAIQDSVTNTPPPRNGTPRSPQTVAIPELKKHEFDSQKRPGTPDGQKLAASPERMSVRDAKALWGHPHGHIQLSPNKSLPNVQSKQQEAPAIEREDRGRETKSFSSTNQQRDSTLQQSSPQPPILPENKKPLINLSSKPVAANNGSSVDSPKQPRPTEAENVLVDFFGRIPSTSSKIDVDVNSVVNSKAADANNIRTSKKQIRELASDGKLLPVSPQEEHVLINDRMYLCTHEYADPQNSSKIESYLWIGAVVAEAAVEDAQLFARREAKNAGGPLIAVRQGKEPAGFFSALGGILITRVGRTKEASSSYILCGRSHLGHLAFDEVPLSASSLCSGFPYLICASSGKVFLWKGAGCSTEELAAARLLSMDIGQTGEVQEIDEGKEPSQFFSVFPAAERTISKSAEHWKIKGAHEHYACRLFHIEHSDRPLSRQNSGTSGIWNIVRRGSQPDLKSAKQTQVKELRPFTQSDLKSENIYVLDAYFDLYIILGSTAKSKPEAFTAALIFAQEYANLACSSEGRPHVPVATVVIEGVPKDMKRVFRRWDDDLSKTRNGPAQSGLKRGKTLKILPLSKALAALGSR